MRKRPQRWHLVAPLVIAVLCACNQGRRDEPDWRGGSDGDADGLAEEVIDRADGEDTSPDHDTTDGEEADAVVHPDAGDDDATDGVEADAVVHPDAGDDDATDGEEADAGPCMRSYACRSPSDTEWIPTPVSVEVFGTSTGPVCAILDMTTDTMVGEEVGWERSLDGGATWDSSILGEGNRLPSVRLSGWFLPPYGQQLIRAVDTACPEEPLVVDFLPPGSESTAIGFSVQWVTEGAAPESDVDLMILRDPSECWTDERHRVLANNRFWQNLDWGRFGPGDEPIESSRDIQEDGTEWILASGREPSERWTVMVRVFDIPEGGRVTATFEILEGGETVLSQSRTFRETDRWIVAEGAESGWTLVNDVVAGRSLPVCDIASRCPDGNGEHEVCDGVDNDCDGEIDENPDACYNAGNGRANCDRGEIEGDVFYLCRLSGDGDERPP